MSVESESEQSPRKSSWSIGNYAVGNELGRGGYGSVFEATHKITGKKVAIKAVLGYSCTQKTYGRCLRELEIIKRLSHDNVASAAEVLYNDCLDGSVYIVMELFPADLRKLIHSSEWLEPIQVKKIMYEAMVGLNYIHSAGIVHRDIKPANILVNEKCEVKICDFNLARSTHGLTSDSFDFDKIYRKEFSSSLPSTLSADSEPEDETIPDELDDSAEEHKIVSLPGRFDVGIGKTHARMALTSQSSDTLRKSLATPTPPKKPHREGSVSDLGMRKIVRRDDKPKDLDLRRKALMNNTQSKISKRELTTHVTTRWYRAPEVVLMDRVYSSAVDIWSMGCVLGELLQTVKGCVAAVADRRPMFPGTSCYPLSPGKRHCSGDGDQLDKILSITGTPSEEDVAFLTEYGAKQYIKQMKKYAKADFAKLFPVADPLAIDLLGKMLTFNPYLRITAKEALEHPYFREVRCPAKEVEAQQIVLKAEHAADRRAALISLCK